MQHDMANCAHSLTQRPVWRPIVDREQLLRNDSPIAGLILQHARATLTDEAAQVGRDGACSGER